MYTINYGGQLFGMNMIFLSLGYIIAINALQLKQFQVGLAPKKTKNKRKKSLPDEKDLIDDELSYQKEKD